MSASRIEKGGFAAMTLALALVANQCNPNRQELLQTPQAPRPQETPTQPTSQPTEPTFPTVESTPKVYTGRIESLRGKPLITDARFDSLSSSLTNSGERMLQKIGTNANTLYTATTLPSDLPNIIASESFPLPITREFSITSTASIEADIDTASPGFIYDKEPEAREWHFAFPARIGINIGTDQRLTDEDPLQEAILLAKEELTLMLETRIFQEYHNTFNKGKFLELDGSPMVDPNRLANAGLVVGLTETSQRESYMWKLVDIAPVMLMAPAIVRLVGKGRLPQSSFDLSSFYKVANKVYSNTDLASTVERLADMWSGSGELDGPEGFSSELNKPQINAAILDLYVQLYSTNN